MSPKTTSTVVHRRPRQITRAIAAALLEPQGALTCKGPLPDTGATLQALAQVRRALLWEFQGDETLETLSSSLSLNLATLVAQVETALRSQSDLDAATAQKRSRDIVTLFLQSLPEWRLQTVEDGQAACRYDPACASVVEALFCLPGPLALGYHRFAHFLYQHEVPLLPRTVAEFVHRSTGIDIHPGARIGRGVFIDHGTGVVIGETAEVGDRVRLYQSVTLGALRFEVDSDGTPLKGVLRHPIIDTDVVIYAGATVLGRIHVGSGSIIGAMARVTRDVAPGSSITSEGTAGPRVASTVDVAPEGLA